MGVSVFGFGSTTSTSPDHPNIMWAMQNTGISIGLPRVLNQVFNARDNLFDHWLAPHIGQDAFFLSQCLGLPKSTGYVELRDANPMSMPIINPQYYADDEDMHTMIEGIHYILDIFENSTSLGLELGATLSPLPVPGCELFEHRSLGYWECVIRTLTSTIYHPAGTCKMGRVDGPMSVVDSSLRVKGVGGLRVADASIMPRVTNANLNAPSIVIGEMCSDMIKETWGLLSLH